MVYIMDVYDSFSNNFHVKKITKEDIPAALQLCIGNPMYYEHMKMEPTLENLEEVIEVLPPNKTLEDKYFMGYYKEGKLIALLDLIFDYPDKNIAFIGWFIMDKKWQGKGIGTKIIKDLEKSMKAHGFYKLRLGYVKDNEQSAAFWKKNDFLPTGSERDDEQYTVVILDKIL